MSEPITTESRNPSSSSIDKMTALEIVRLMNAEDARVADAVATQAEVIAEAIDVITARLRRGGRLIYVGAGTSGRLGVLDASECPPTFRTEPWQVVGVIAGGHQALTRAIEGAEDIGADAQRDLEALQISSLDVVVGIATSGRTPYVIAGLEYAHSVNSATVSISCNSDSALLQTKALHIVPVVGPEVVSGSTRLKSGTATKMVLNMLSTGAMVRLGKTFGNLMVDLRATNQKLAERSVRIMREVTGLTADQCQELLDAASGEVKTAITMHWHQLSAPDARQRLEEADGHLHLIQSSS